MSYNSNALVGGILTELNRLLSQRNEGKQNGCWPRGRGALAACRLGVACVFEYTHMRVVKMAVPYEQENALALQRSSFRENPT